MNEITDKPVARRTFQVTLFNETREVSALPLGSGGTRFLAVALLAGRYRTGRRLHRSDIEIETDPVEVARLTQHQFGWSCGRDDSGAFAFRIYSSRDFGNPFSQVRAVGWADKYPQSRFA